MLLYISWSQGVGTLVDGYQSFLICTWAWWFSYWKKQTRTNELIQKEIWINNLPPIRSKYSRSCLVSSQPC